MKVKLIVLFILIFLIILLCFFKYKIKHRFYLEKLYFSGNVEHYEVKEKIPKIIHQTWKTQELPENFKLWSNIIKEKHPDWKYMLWTDESNRNFIKENYSWFLDIYDSYDENIKRVDSVRYFLLYHYGGVYIDMDFICLKSLDGILNTNKAVFGYQFKDENKIGSIANAFMACPPKHHLFELCINMLQYFTKEYVLNSTGPTFLTYMIKNYYFSEELKIYKMPIIYTNEWNEKGCVDYKDCLKKYPNSYMSTFWTGTWNKK